MKSYCTVQYSTVLYCTVQYCTVLYSTVQYCTVLYCAVLYRNTCLIHKAQGTYWSPMQIILTAVAVVLCYIH